MRSGLLKFVEGAPFHGTATMHSQHSQSPNTLTPASGSLSSHTHYLLMMREGKLAGAIPALEPPRLPSELRPSPVRARARRWAARRIGWLR